MDRIRAQVDTCAWAAILLGLGFTAVNVQTFAAAGAPAWSPAWSVAWLLDPMVSLLLIAVLRAEQVTARWQVPTGPRVIATKWGCFAATYTLNTWASWRDGLPAGVVLHSVPPLVVLLGAEVAPELRDRLTTAATTAAASAATSTATSTPAPVGPAPAPPVIDPLEAGGASVDDERAVLVGSDDATHVLDVAASLEPDPVSGVEAGCEPDDDETDRPYTVIDPAGPVDPVDPVDPDNRVDADTPVDVVDPRVAELVELLTAGAAISGDQAAALHQVSARTGRRLLADARAHLTEHPPRPDLHLVQARTAGGTP